VGSNKLTFGIIILISAILLIPLMYGQSAYAGGISPAVEKHFYEFNGNFEDTLGGPTLTDDGGDPPQGTITQTTYEFDDHQGLELFFPSVSSDNYSIEMCLKVNDGQDNEFEGWRKLIDFKNFDSNNGLYVSGGGGRTDQLEFANLGFNGPTKITNGEFFHVVLTRDGNTDDVTVYLDGIEEFDFNDNSARAVFDKPGKVMQFIQGDHPGEQPDGTIDYIKIYDGVLGSDEVAFNASSCPAEPEPEVIEVSTCQTLSVEGATYLLTNSITTQPAIDGCFTITADNIVFDGGGHTINGEVTCDETTYGVGVFDSDGVTVKNLNHVRNFDDGILYENSDDGLIQNNFIRDNCDDGISLNQGSERNTVDSNVVRNNGNDGISVDNNSNDNVIIDNFSGDNTDDGIDLEDSTGNLFDGNVVGEFETIIFGLFIDASGNDEEGFNLDRTDGNTFKNNIALDNNHGFDMEDSDNNIFEDNDASFNDNDLIKIKNSNGNTFTRNTANGSDEDDGFDLEGAVGNTFIDNIANDNDGEGFEVGITDGTGGSHENVFTGNTANNNEGEGVKINFSNDNTFTGNTFDDNISDGVEIRDSLRNVFSGNSITSNGNDGRKLNSQSSVPKRN
jgi:parallel beta-helix repeat protein